MITIIVISLLVLVVIGAGTSATIMNITDGASKIASDPRVQEITAEVGSLAKEKGKELAYQVIEEVMTEIENRDQ